MIRRRRPAREVAFSFDSFLDVVTNVVGIILRLILVAWVGARSYKAVVPARPPAPAAARPAPLPVPADPLAAALKRRRGVLADDRARLAQALRRVEEAAREAESFEEEVDRLGGRRRALEAEKAALAGKVTAGGVPAGPGLEQLRARCRELAEELSALGKAPAGKKSLRYRTPVSRPVTEEVMFECRRGRVTLLDTAALLEEVRREMRTAAEGLKASWEVSGVTAPAGAFRLRYVLERERAGPEGPTPAATASFRYGLSGWEAEPVRAERGEGLGVALAPGSGFRRVVDALDPDQTAVTLWVYPDSFALYRALRDYLHDREVVVAGRPLPEGVPIASSRKGTVSRGQ
jgi:hypothetical protein